MSSHCCASEHVPAEPRYQRVFLADSRWPDIVVAQITRQALAERRTRA